MEDIKYRAYRFAVRVIKYLREQDWTKRMNEPLFRQLLRSSTSIRANRAEGRSWKPEWEIMKYYRIALRSVKETKYLVMSIT
ncbi:MAG: four helix bundle protein [Chitinophagales bacterium]|nr:four helix bundle protein [Chitinophagales bacterium]